jgi:hypothetical protein
MTAGSPGTPMPAGYRYLRHLGAGGFGDVHLAEHLATGRRAAVKHIQRHALSDPDTVARFKREARILAATDAASVVRVYDLDTTGDPAYLIMEYVPGVTLWDLIESAPMPASQGIAILQDVAEALRLMGERGLVHRDIKPSNVFVLPDGSAKLGDFGLARAVADDAGFRTAGAPAGTPAYFPPEVSAGTAEATAESDAYSFAVMAYEVLTGVRPIVAPDAVSLITAHWTQPPRPVEEALPGFPAQAAPVLMRALAKEPAGRPLPHELMGTLRAVPAEQWPTNDRPPVPEPEAPPESETATGPLPGGAPTTVLAPETGGAASYAGSAPVTVRSEQVAPAPAAVTAPPSRRGRRTLPAVAATAVVLLATGAGGWLWVQRDDAAPPQAGTPALAVQTVSLTADPARGRCPRARLTVVATIATNGGAGEVVVAWTLPDGSRGPDQPFAVAEGQTEVRASLGVDLSGSRPIRAEVAATVRPSGLRATTPVVYTCPERSRAGR